MAEARPKKSRVDRLRVIRDAAASFGYSSIKIEQEAALEAFTNGRDVFVSLPTGYGKSLCYALLPRIFDMLRTVDKASIAIIISPLISLMQDQVATFNQKGLLSVCISGKNEISRVDGKISACLHEPRVTVL